MSSIFAFENQHRLGDVRAMQLDIDARIATDKARAESEARQQRLLAEMEQAGDAVPLTAHVVELDTTVSGAGHVRVFMPEAAV